jgi:anti-anti-sigma factor
MRSIGGTMNEVESGELEVIVKIDDEIPTIELTGRIIDADVKKFQRRLDQFYKKKTEKIILDVSNATYMDSHGLGTLVYYHTLMQKEGREFIILNTNTEKGSYLNKLFEFTNLDKVLTIVKEL